jgi:hypothetical protein
MFKRFPFLDLEPGAEGGAAGGAAPAAAPDAPAPAAAPPAAPSLMARGASAAPAAPAAPAADGDAAPVAVPEKYQVKNEDGTVNHEATALKLAEGYAHLSKRMGGGDAPPKSPDEYAPPVPAGLTLEALKQDPMFTGFLKGAHSKGMTNAQVGYVLEAMAEREAMRSSPEIAEAELRKEWKTDADLQAGLAQSFRAAKAYAGGDEQFAKIEAKFGSDPDFIRLMARIGKELGEDTQPAAGITSSEAMTLESLMASPAYFDGKHPDHRKVVAQVSALYAKKTGGA